MRQPTRSTNPQSWARHAQAANGFGDAIILETPSGPARGHAAGNGTARPDGAWSVVTDAARALFDAVRALSDAARARAAERRQRRLARETFLVLNGLDGRTLRDLGFDRSEIASVACEVAGLAAPTRTHPARFTQRR